MASWTDIPNSSLETGKPARSVDALAFRDNPIAIAEGATGAPKIDPLLAFNHGGNVGLIGTYAFLGRSVAPNTTIATPGTVVSGSTLKYAQASNVPAATGVLYTASPSGSWRCCGYLKNANDTYTRDITTLWLRIA